MPSSEKYSLILLTVVLLLANPWTVDTAFFQLIINENPWDSLKIQPWRIFSAQFVHTNTYHFAMNLINVLLLGLALQHWLTPLRSACFLILSSLVISIGLNFLGELHSYLGFSGVFHGLALILFLDIYKENRLISWLGIGFITGKLIYEQVFGASTYISDSIGASIAIDAHTLGAFSAIIFYVTEWLLSKIPYTTSSQ